MDLYIYHRSNLGSCRNSGYIAHLPVKCDVASYFEMVKAKLKVLSIVHLCPPLLAKVCKS